MDPRELDRHTGYRPGFKFHDENLRMLAWYAERLVGALRRGGARSLLSLGIGHQVVSRRIIAEVGLTLDEYTIVEGSAARIAELRALGPLPARVRLEHALFEEYAPASDLEAVEMGFVLEHVLDPGLVLRRFASRLRPGGLAVVVVPNARSLHRLVGHRAGLLPDLYALSPHDHELGHRRYFDLPAVRALVEDAGLRVTRAEGVFLKCMSTAQLASLHLTPEVVDAFFEVGVGYPEIANAIYLEAAR